jgi:transposase
MTGTRKRYSAAFEARVALEAAKQTRTVAELSKAFQVHPVQISQWKKELLDGAESLFGDVRRRERDQSETLQAELYHQIGRLNMGVEWLKKKLPAAPDLKRPLVELEHPRLSIRRLRGGHPSLFPTGREFSSSGLSILSVGAGEPSWRAIQQGPSFQRIKPGSSTLR